MGEFFIYCNGARTRLGLTGDDGEHRTFDMSTEDARRFFTQGARVTGAVRESLIGRFLRRRREKPLFVPSEFSS